MRAGVLLSTGHTPRGPIDVDTPDLLAFKGSPVGSPRAKGINLRMPQICDLALSVDAAALPGHH